MSNETVGNLSAQRNARNAIERVQALETVIFGETPKDGERKPGVIESLSKQLDQVQQQLSEAVEVLDAVAKAIGPDAVGKIVTETRVENARNDAKRQQDQLQKLLAAGQLKAVPAIGENSFVVGVETKPDGAIVEPGWFMHHMSQLKPTAKEALAGQAVGFKFATESGGQYEVKEIYEVQQVPATQPAPEPTPGLQVDNKTEVFTPGISSTPPKGE
jgi:hypothetical protein